MTTYVRITRPTDGIWIGNPDKVHLPAGTLAEELGPGHLQPVGGSPAACGVPTTTYMWLDPDDEEVSELAVASVMES
jgi:hypothetical protein